MMKQSGAEGTLRQKGSDPRSTNTEPDLTVMIESVVDWKDLDLSRGWRTYSR